MHRHVPIENLEVNVPLLQNVQTESGEPRALPSTGNNDLMQLLQIAAVIAIVLGVLFLLSWL